uniref:MYND-type domain-containing protein n=1 Tax=Anopheles merus TaxID=30066 RepID=A0A182V5E0_ANOME
MANKYLLMEGVHMPTVTGLFQEMWESTIKDKLEAADKKKSNNNYSVVQLLIHEIGTYLRSHPYRERLFLHPDLKDEAHATFLRAKGNELFHKRARKYIAATVYYNESIAHSPKGSEVRAIGYGNRAAVCLQLGRYEDCLANIRLARDSNYPAALMGKLTMREVAAQSMQASAEAARRFADDPMEPEDQHAQELKLSYPAHPTVPQRVADLMLCNNQQYGRHVVATRQLRVGDVVMVEKPYATVLSDHMKRVRCAFCHAEEPFLLIPCEECTIAMYCSQKCLRAAWQQYHRYECPILNDMRTIGTEYLALAVRTVAIALASFDHDLEALRAHLSQLDVSKVNAFEMDWRAASPKTVYETVYSLATNQRKRGRKDFALNVLVAMITHDLLLKRTPVAQVCGADPILQKALLNLLLHHLQSTIVNHQFLHYMDYLAEQDVYEPDEYAIACFPLLSMLNHSCAPNVKRITMRDGRCALLVTRQIADGGQLFDHYDVHHWMIPRKERQKILKQLYKFTCECEACVKDYDSLLGFVDKHATPIEFVLTGSINARLVVHSEEEAFKWLPMLRDYMNSAGRHYPASLSVVSMSQMIRCYQILHTYTSWIPMHRYGL